MLFDVLKNAWRFDVLRLDANERSEHAGLLPLACYLMGA